MKFLARGLGYSIFLTGTQVLVALPHPAAPLEHSALDPVPRPSSARPPSFENVLQLKLAHANPSPTVSASRRLPGVVNYLVGSNPQRWRTRIPTFGLVRYHNVYPGIDLVYYGNQSHLEYDFQIAPGADPSRIRLQLAGPGHPLEDPSGVIRLDGPNGQARLLPPRIYQIVDGSRHYVSGSYALTRSHEIGFRVSRYDRRLPLIIDPVLEYSTYLGGSGLDQANGIAIDPSGDAYITGFTTSSDFPTTAGVAQSSLLGGSNAFVAELNPSGTALLYSTYVGGSNADQADAIAVDPQGHAYITGVTFSADFPVTAGAAQTSFGGAADAFLAELSPAGSSLLYSTYLGGSAEDQALAIGLNPTSPGEVFIAGKTFSSNFPLQSALQTKLVGTQNGFLAEFQSGSLVYSTYLGGNGYDQINAIAADSSGNAYVTGYTSSTNFPLAFPIQSTCASCPNADDAFVAEMASGGGSLIYSTYLGGSADDQGASIAVDGSGNAYITGFTFSSNFPTTSGAFQTSLQGTSAAFVAKIASSGSSLAYSTFLGGNQLTYGQAIALLNGNAYVTGITNSTNFPTVSPIQSTSSGAPDAFVSELATAGGALLFSSYFGGSSFDDSRAIALDSYGDIFLAGATVSTDFPTANPFEPSYNGGYSDSFVAMLAVPATDTISPTSLSFAPQLVNTSSAPQTVTVTNTGSVVLHITNIGITGTSSGDFAQTNNCGASVAAGSNCTINVTFTPLATGTRSASLSIYDNVSGSPQIVGLSGTGTATPVSLTPASITFGTQLLGTASASQPLTLQNSGSTALTISSIAITGFNATDFAETNNCGSSLAAGAGCTINVTFSPTAVGTRNASVTVTDSAPTSPQTATLTGNGTTPALPISLAAKAYGTYNNGTTPQASISTGAFSLPTGDLAVVFCGVAANTSAPPTVTDQNGNVFVQIGTNLASTKSETQAVFYAANAQGVQSDSVTCTWPAAYNNLAVMALAYSGIDPNAPLDTQATGFVRNSSLLQTGAFSTSSPNEVIVAGMMSGSGCAGQFTPGAGYTVEINAIPTGCASGMAAVEDRIVSSAQTNTTASMTFALKVYANIFAATFRAATPAPAISFSPNALSFPSQPVGSTSPSQTVTVSNAGSAALSISSIAITGANSGDFAQTNNCGSSLAAGSKCAVNVTFTPASSGTRTASLTFTDNANGSPQSVSLTGTGAGSATLSPTSLAFSNQTVGTTSTAQSLTLSNSGNSSLSISGIAITGTNSGDFAQTNNCGMSLAAGSNCSINVTFTPSATGTRTASLSVTDSDPSSPQIAGLSGTGTGSVTLSPASVTFANQAVGTTSPAQTVTLSNSGGAALSISSIAISGTNSGDFAQANNCGASLAAGSNCSISVTFTPSASGTRSASLVVTDNAAGSPQTASLSGTGTGAIVTLAPSSLTFASQSIGTTSPAQSVSLSNTGNATLSISSIAISGANSSEFAQTNNCSTTLNPGSGCTINVTFSPLASGTRSASLTITDNAAGSPQSASLTGTGASAGPGITLATKAYGAYGNTSVTATSVMSSPFVLPTGDLLVTYCGLITSQAATPTVTDTAGNVFTQIGSTVAGSGGDSLSMFYAANATGNSADSVTCAWSSGYNSLAVMAMVYSGVASVSPVDISATGFARNSTTLQTSAFSTSSANEVIVAGMMSGSGCVPTPTPGTGYTIEVTAIPSGCGGPFAVTEDQIASTVQTNITASMTSSSNIWADILAASFKPASQSAVSLTPSSLTFPSQTVNTMSAAQTITLSNSGSASLSISSIAITGTNSGDFGQTNNCGSSLAASSNCTINITFTPTATGTRTASLSVTDSDPSSPQSASLSGTGVASAASLSPTSLTFASQTVNTTSAAQTITLSNSGSASLSISSIAITGTNSGDFGQTNNCGSSLAAGSNCAINITFTPTATGTRTASLTVTDNASGSPQSASLTGTGAQATGSGPTLVQVQNNIDTTTTAHTSFSVNISTLAGDLLVAFVRESSNGTDNFTVTDSAGQVWQLTASGYENESSSGPRVAMFYMPNSAAVSSVTVNYTTSGGVIRPGIMVLDFSGMATSSVADGSVNNRSGASVTISASGGLATSNANDILIFATDTSGNENGWTAGTGYTIPNNNLTAGASGSNVRMAIQWTTVSSTQTNATASMTYPNANWNGNVFAAFKQ